jgi:two-component system, cell cycle sensor histidine kinase and response regulator CckA
MSEGSQRGLGTEVLHAAPDGIFAVDLQGRCLFMNEAAAEALGYQPGELEGRDIHEVIHSRRADGSPYPAEFCPMNRAMRDRTSSRTPHEVLWRSDGTCFPVEYTTGPIWRDGRVTGAVVMFRDTTDQRLYLLSMQAQLARTAAQAALLDLTPVSIVVRDIEGRASFWNVGAERLFGWTRAEAVGQPVHALLRTELPAPLGEIHEMLVEAGQWEGELRHRSRDGRLVVAASQWSLRRDDQGQPDAVLEVSVDMTRAAAADAKFRGLLEAAPDAILGVDGEGRIALVNAQAEHLFGYSREELMGQDVEILVPEAARGVHPGHRAGYFLEPRARPMGAGMQLSARRRDGSEFPAEISLSALVTEQGVLVSAAVRDVSERIEAQAARERLKAEAERARLESQLRQSQRLESLGQLAGGVAHDFNNLLAVILSYSGFVAEELEAEVAERPESRWAAVRNDVAQIQRAAERATRLTHQLLAFGRREVVRPEVLSLNDRVAETEQMLRRTIGEHIKLRTALAPDLWSVLADPGQIDQVLVNLAVNARDAMTAGGELTIGTANVEVTDGPEGHDVSPAGAPGMPPGRYACLRVEDTGTGIPREHLDRVFEPFFTTKPKGQGTGLGLATVYGIIAQAGGHAHIASEPGRGTTVSALLPAVAAAPASGTAGPAASAGGTGQTVLVVEDEDAIREVTRRVLARNGYRVLEAAGGAEALAIALEHGEDIDLLLTDVIMPNMLGKEVAQRVTALRPTAKVLFMSGYAQPVLASQGTLDEGVRLIEKPFSEAELLGAVRELLMDGPAA